MAEYELLEERRVSGKGVLKAPGTASDIRAYILYADVIRMPKSPYLNYNYNPPRGRYATLVFLRNGYVIGQTPMEFDRQSIDGIEDITGQNLIAIKCMYDGILTTFVNFAIALNLAPFQRDNLIEDYESLHLSWDEVRIRCYADTAIQLRMFGLKYDTCKPEFVKEESPPPPPPPKPRVPPGTPINDLSQPYDSDSNDDNNTAPYPDDTPEPPPPPQPKACDKVRVTVRAEYANGSAVLLTLPSGGTQYAPIVEAFVSNEGSGYTGIKVRGGAQVGTQGCNEQSNFEINYALNFNAGNPFVTAEIVSMEIVP